LLNSMGLGMQFVGGSAPCWAAGKSHTCRRSSGGICDQAL